jgi:glycerol uptake facilitator protein
MPASTTQRLAAELLGTMFLVFFGAAAVTAAAGGLTGVALAHGLALAVAIWAFGTVSGAFVNPAVTIAIALRGRLSWADAAMYLVAQAVGGFLAALLVWAVYGNAGIGRGLGTTHLAAGVTVAGGLVAEAVGTVLLMTAVYVLAVRERAPVGFAGLGIGFALVAGILAVGPLTGASFNPARTLGPELVLTIGGGNADWSHVWVYLVGPLAGAALAAYTYDYLIQKRTPAQVSPTINPVKTARRR